MKVKPDFIMYEISVAKRSRKHCSSRHLFTKSLFITIRSLKVSILFTFAYNFTNHFTYTLEHTVILLKYMMIEHVFVNLASLSKNSALTNFESWQNNVCFMN